MNYQSFRLLLVHAHPDDETINNGVTMAKYVDLGASVTLITCTRGEEGDILVDGLGHLAASQDDRLGEHRVIELAKAMDILGVKDHRFLGHYRDSGMMGSESNKRATSFWQADVEKASDELVKIIDEIKPHVLITYDEFGGYGHPDHIQTHRVAMRASEKSEWKISKIYWNTIPKSNVIKSMEALREKGSTFMGAESIEDIPFAKDDSFVTCAIDGNKYVSLKMDAMRAHATQISVDGPFFALSDHLGFQVWGTEYYTLVRGQKHEPFDGDGREKDLFAGISP